MSSLRNKTVLVVGSAGSIGSALCSRISYQNPKNLIILDQDETGIFNLYEELKDRCKVTMAIATIRDEERIADIFRVYKPDIVYHAAAYKHVAMMEKFPQEAFKTNVLGTFNLVQSAVENAVKKFIFVSTDKAVNPICIMGKTKRTGELMCLSMNGKTKFIVVRFGNVMASRGSVIPIWQKQINEGKPVTVTDKGMKRYFMGIYEAVDLILQATEMGKGGETMILDMGKQVKVCDIAKFMIKASGKPLNIVYTSPKQGEKFSEELMTKREKRRAVKKNGIYIIHGRK